MPLYRVWLVKNVAWKCDGVDAIQAFYLVLQLIGNRLYTIDEFKTGRLSWPFSVDVNDLGFPTAV
jgi:uncharacterized membrane protein